MASTFQGRCYNVQTTSRHRFDAFLWVHAPVPYNTALRWRLKRNTLIGRSNFFSSINRHITFSYHCMCMWHKLTKQQCGWSNTTKPTIPKNNLHGTNVNVKVTYVIPTHTTSMSTSFVESVACREGNNSRSIYCSARNNSWQLFYFYLERKRSTYMYQNMRALRHSFNVIDLGYGLMGKRWSAGWCWLK